MSRVRPFIMAALLLLPTSGEAQLIQRVLGRAPPAPALIGVDAARADFLAKTGTDTLYFAGDTAVLTVPMRTTLAAQAAWLRQNPGFAARIEGHADLGDTRDHALAVGARRAEEVRQFLLLMGVPAAQVAATTMGKEKPGPGRTQTVLVEVPQN
jgi:peptidoglycan-associated lipoprotein